jgi:hypothetical protein
MNALRNWWLTFPGLVLIAGLAAAAVAWWLIAVPVVTLSNIEKHAGHFPWVYLHMLGGTLMLILGAANLYIGSTRQFWRFHKAIGYTYLSGGTVSSLIAIPLALGQVHNADASFSLTDASDMGVSLASLSIAWLIASGMALRAAINRRFDSHQAWMIRSYVLTWSFVLCRLAGRIPAFSDLGDGAAAVWLSWIVPLILAEVCLQWRAGANNSFKPKPLRGSA